MTINPPSAREEFNGFQSFYESDIKPFFHEWEDARQQAVMQGGLIVIATAVIAFAFYTFAPFDDFKIKLAIFTGFGGVALAGWRVNKTRGAISEGLLAKVCRHLGFSYRMEIGRPDFCSDFDRLSMLPSFNREHWEDEVRGARHGAEFVFCESHLKYKSSGKNSSTRTVFHGQLLVIDYHKEFLGETVVKRDAGMFNRLNKPGKNFQQVGIVSSEFEKIFEAWSTDQVEARELLDPLVLERFNALDKLFDGAKLRAAFSKGKLYLALETGDKLNMGTMFKPIKGPERVETILKEFDLIFDLIDLLMKQIEGRLDRAVSLDAVKSA